MATHYPTIDRPRILGIGRAAVGGGVRVLATAWGRVAGWRRSVRDKRELRALDASQLDDAGITPQALRDALDRPFWRTANRNVGVDPTRKSRSDSPA